MKMTKQQAIERIATIIDERGKFNPDHGMHDASPAQALRSQAAELYETYAENIEDPADIVSEIRADLAYDAGDEQYAAQEEWANEHPECDASTDDLTDEAIRVVLDARQIRHHGPSGVSFAGSAAEFRDAVKAGMDVWWREVQAARDAE
jgi:hypothetical protein